MTRSHVTTTRRHWVPAILMLLLMASSQINVLKFQSVFLAQVKEDRHDGKAELFPTQCELATQKRTKETTDHGTELDETPTICKENRTEGKRESDADSSAGLGINGKTHETSPRLELIHIQKNAGSLLETLAMEANISWGTCHFSFPWKARSAFRNCPPLNYTSVTNKTVFWHYPLQQMVKESGSLPVFPYDNISNSSYAARPKRYFVVVRNPYTRLVSFFYQAHGQGWKKKKERLTPADARKYFNEFLQKIVQEGRHVGLLWDNSTICQSQYLFDEVTGEPIPDVDHVVQFEYLAQDFDALAQQYGLDLRIPDRRRENAHNYSDPGTLSVDDISAETLGMANRRCPRDFELGRGYQMIWDPSERNDGPGATTGNESSKPM